MNTSAVIRTEALSYQYAKGVNTLTDISIQVDKGSIYGFLGPNGSGKTTTLSLLLGLLKMQKGSIEIFGQEVNAGRIDILKRTGALIEAPSLYGHLTARENLEVYQKIYSAPKQWLTEVLKIVGLADTGKKTVKKFSLGMKQRLSIALALLPNPQLLVLDEPSNGLDPAGIIELRELIRKLNQDSGMTIIISSHLLSEVEKMVSHIGIIDKGKLLFQGTLSDLKLFQRKASKLLIRTSDNHKARQLLHAYNPDSNGQTLSIAYHDIQQVADINRALTSNNVDVYLLHPKENDLEELFIHLTSDAS